MARRCGRQRPPALGGGHQGRSSGLDNVERGDAVAAAPLLSERIYVDLRRRILGAELQPGDRLVLRRLAIHYGASEIPVREALRRLQQDQLVHVTPHAGARVARLGVEEVREALIVRSRLEGLATETACAHLTAADRRRLGDLVDRMAEAAARDDPGRYTRLNKEFHQAIFRRCPYRLLLRLLDGLWHDFGLAFHRGMRNMDLSLAEHRELLSLLAAGQAEAAGRLAERHKLRAAQALERPSGTPDGRLPGTP